MPKKIVKKPISKARPATRTRPDLSRYLDEARDYRAGTPSRQRLVDDAIELANQAFDEAVRRRLSGKQYQLDNDLLAIPPPRSAEEERAFVLGLVSLAFALKRAAGRFATAAIVKADAGPKRRRQQEIYVAWDLADVGVDTLAALYDVSPAVVIADRVAELERWKDAPRDVDGHRDFAITALRRLSKTAKNRGLASVVAAVDATIESLK